MSSPVATRMNRIKSGTCPHGMPAGACPICNGMGSGVSNKQQNVRKAGEMTWSECFAMGLRMKADRLHKQQIIQERRDAHLALLRLQEVLSARLQKLENLKIVFERFLPAPVAKIANGVVNIIAIPIIKIVQKLTSIMQNLNINLQQMITTLKENIQGAQEKLAAIFGEIFNSKEKFLSERFKLARKKVFAFLFDKITEDNEIEIKEIEKEEVELELKKVKDSLLNLNNYKQEVEDELNSAV